MHDKTTIKAVGLGFAGLLLAGSGDVLAAVQDGQPATVLVQGVQVAIDPATGRLVTPSEAQRQALSAAMLQQAASPSPRAVQQRPLTEADALKTLRQFSIGPIAAMMQLPETLMSSLVAERQVDGSVAVHHQGEAARAVAQEVTQ